MEVNGVENEDDFHEFQLRHHHSRFRRDAAGKECKYQTYGFWGLCLTEIFLGSPFWRVFQDITVEFFAAGWFFVIDDVLL